MHCLTLSITDEIMHARFNCCHCSAKERDHLHDSGLRKMQAEDEDRSPRPSLLHVWQQKKTHVLPLFIATGTATRRKGIETTMETVAMAWRTMHMHARARRKKRKERLSTPPILLQPAQQQQPSSSNSIASLCMGLINRDWILASSVQHGMEVLVDVKILRFDPIVS